MEKNYRIGTRTSPLALKQAEEILAGLRRFYPSLHAKIVGIDTYGDRDRDTPISRVERSDFFTREIDEALLEGEIDFAVHSAKDLPDEPRDGITATFITDAVDPSDALVSRRGLTLEELPYMAKIGTSSLRRKEGLKKFRADFEIQDIRGNIGERLDILEKQGLEGIVIAACALKRLGMEDRITQKIPFNIIAPHPLQGRLAVTARKSDEVLNRLFGPLRAERRLRNEKK